MPFFAPLRLCVFALNSSYVTKTRIARDPTLSEMQIKGGTQTERESVEMRQRRMLTRLSDQGQHPCNDR